ncbi:MAG: HAD family hydrolase [Euzebya sp.]
MLRMIATDIDGTLLRSDGTVSARTRAAVAAVENAGLTFVLVTGRPPRWLAPVRDQLDHRGVAICANGALVMDLHSEKVVQVNAFEADVARTVLKHLRTISDQLGFGVEWPDGFAHERNYPRGIRQSEMVAHAVTGVTEDEEFFARPVIKFLVRGEGQVIEDLAAAASDLTQGLATVTWSGIGLLEISAADVTKASALEHFAKSQGISADEVVAFGDMPNDLAMLTWAGLGVAVANAHPLVLQAADQTTSSNDEDGVAAVLERLLD